MSYDLLIDGGGAGDTPLGTVAEIRRQVEAVFPSTAWSPAGWGSVSEGEGSIEFNIPDSEPITSFGIHLRGEFIVFLERVDQLAAANGWTVFDPQDPSGLA